MRPLHTLLHILPRDTHALSGPPAHPVCAADSLPLVFLLPGTLLPWAAGQLRCLVPVLVGGLPAPPPRPPSQSPTLSHNIVLSFLTELLFIVNFGNLFTHLLFVSPRRVQSLCEWAPSVLLITVSSVPGTVLNIAKVLNVGFFVLKRKWKLLL